MAIWNWKVPSVEGTRWEQHPRETVGRYVHVGLNVYCEGAADDAHPLYLVGRFRWGEEVNGSPIGPEAWTFYPEFETGDGQLIRLHGRAQQAGRWPTGQMLAGDRLVGDTDADALDAAHTFGGFNLHTTFDLHCRTCRRRRSIRHDVPGLWAILDRLNAELVREISLPALIGLLSSRGAR